MFFSCKTSSKYEKQPSSEMKASTSPHSIEGSVKNFFYDFKSIEKTCEDNQIFSKFELKLIDDVPVKSLSFDGKIILEPKDLKEDAGIDEADIFQINYLIRFDICIDQNDDVFLHRIILKKQSYYAFGGLNPKFHTLEPSKTEKSDALKRAIFSDEENKVDYSDIEMVFYGGDKSENPSYYVKGHTLSSGQTFLTISPFKKDDSPNTLFKTEQKSSVVTAGLLQEGNPFEKYENPPKQMWELLTYEIDQPSIKLKMAFEVSFHQGGYRSRKFEKKGLLSIEDTNHSLKEPFKVNLQGNAAKDFMQITNTHHNLSDAFIIEDKENHTTYTIQENGSRPKARLIIDYDKNLGIEPIILDLTETFIKSE